MIHDYKLQVLHNRLYQTDPINATSTNRVSPSVQTRQYTDRQTVVTLVIFLHTVQHRLQMHSLYTYRITIILYLYKNDFYDKLLSWRDIFYPRITYLRFGLLVYIPHGGWVPKKSEHCNIVFKFPTLLKFYTENMHYTLKFMRYAEIKDCRNKSDQAHTSTLG